MLIANRILPTGRSKRDSNQARRPRGHARHRPRHAKCLKETKLRIAQYQFLVLPQNHETNTQNNLENIRMNIRVELKLTNKFVLPFEKQDRLHGTSRSCNGMIQTPHVPSTYSLLCWVP